MDRHLSESAVIERIAIDEGWEFLQVHEKKIVADVRSAIFVIDQRGVEAYDNFYLPMMTLIAGDQADSRELLRTAQMTSEAQEIAALKMIHRYDTQARLCHAVYRAIHAVFDTPQTSTVPTEHSE